MRSTQLRVIYGLLLPLLLLAVVSLLLPTHSADAHSPTAPCIGRMCFQELPCLASEQLVSVLQALAQLGGVGSVPGSPELLLGVLQQLDDKLVTLQSK